MKLVTEERLSLPEAARRLSLAPSTLGYWVKAQMAGKLGDVGKTYRPLTEVEMDLETFDWYAQDNDGNVWYFGEDSKEYEEGEVVSTEGSWEAGVDGAKPGIIMKANPQIGDSYRQEHYPGEAEDLGEVIRLNESASVPRGSYDGITRPGDPGME